MKSTLIDLCSRIEVDYNKVMSRSREKDVVLARIIFANLVRGDVNATKIGKFLDRSPANVLYYFSTYESLIKTRDKDLRRLLRKYNWKELINDEVDEFYMNSLI
jgi:chromosomal replication initiation ATPase DnaA